MTKRIKERCKRIEAELQELAKETGAEHITAAYIGDAVYISDLTDINNKKFDYFWRQNNE